MKRKSVAEVLDNPQANEYYVLVTRYYPMEFRKRKLKLKDTPIADWDRDLAPSRELLKDYKNGVIDWEDYTKRFLEEVPVQLMRRKRDVFKEDANGKEVVIVCMEEANEYPKCHTWLILQTLADKQTEGKK